MPSLTFALIIWCCVYPLVTGLNYLFQPIFAQLDPYQSSFILTLIMVPAILFIIAPCAHTLHTYLTSWKK